MPKSSPHRVEPDAAVELEGVSKRFRGGGRLVPVPRILRRRSKGAYWPPRAEEPDEVDPDDDIAEEDMGDEEDEPEEPLPPAPGEEIWALRDLSLRVEHGTVLGVVGPNGSGKSTLLRIVAGMTPVTAGRVVVRGRTSPLLSAAPAFMQPQMTGRENVFFLAELFGVHRDVAEGRLEQIAAFAEVGDQLDAQLKTYSTGLYKRLGISTALNLGADVLLADELPSAGDADFRDRVRRHIEAGRQEGMTMLYASHDMSAIRALCTEAVLLDEGRVVDRGAADEITRSYEPLRSQRQHESAGEATGPLTGPVVTPVEAGIYSLGGEPLTSTHARDETVIEMIAEVAEAEVDLRGTFTIRADGEPVIKSQSPEPWSASEPGRFASTVYLPPGLLGDGRYEVTSRVFATRDGRRLGFAREPAFTFEVFGADEDGPAQLRRLELAWGTFPAR